MSDLEVSHRVLVKVEHWLSAPCTQMGDLEVSHPSWIFLGICFGQLSCSQIFADPVGPTVSWFVSTSSSWCLRGKVSPLVWVLSRHFFLAEQTERTCADCSPWSSTFELLAVVESPSSQERFSLGGDQTTAFCIGRLPVMTNANFHTAGSGLDVGINVSAQWIQHVRLLNIHRLSPHDGMASVLDEGDDSKAFKRTNVVKQGCVLAPTLFSMVFPLC